MKTTRHFLLLLLAFPAAVCAQVNIPNAGFEQADASSGTGSAQWRVEGEGITVTNDSADVYRGKYALKLARTASTGTGFFSQDIPFTAHGLAKYAITCAIKTSDLKGEAGLGVRVFDKDDRTISGYPAITITTNQDWKIITGEFYANEHAARIRIFGKLAGSGTARFDNISIREIPFAKDKPDPKITAYINEYFSYIRKYSVVQDSTRMIALLEQQTQQLCAGHKDLAYCGDVLKRYTTLCLHDGHSFFWTAKEWKQYREGSANTTLAGLVNFASGHMTADHIAYIRVPTFASLDQEIIQRYADSTQAIINMLDAQNPKGWIIDLGSNEGGNAFAMLGGLGPLLGNGICGYSQSADGSKRTRVYDNGYAGWSPDTTFMQRTPVYRLVHTDLPIAMLYSNRTGSSGEVTAISFRGKTNCKSFGQPTAGATTRVDNLELSDGASLNLACGWDADRTGQVYKTAVPPDFPASDHIKSMKLATQWILGRSR